MKINCLIAVLIIQNSNNMRIRKSFYALLAFGLMFMVSCNQTNSNDQISIIPVPMQWQTNKGYFAISGRTKLICSKQNETRKVAEYLAKTIGSYTPFIIEIVDEVEGESNENTILLKIDSSCNNLNSEGYRLKVHSDGIQIQANSAKGLFYGVQSLLQMFPPTFYKSVITSEIIVSGVEITDQPRFPYRGMHLDVSRHMFPVCFIKRYIDLLAMYKYNTFHRRLTDDQGWRIEIKQYPKLTEIGAFRDSTLVGHSDKLPLKYDGEPYGGYYTREQVKDIVQYASDRMIAIIPEIEMPGHTLAALAAYPEYACTEGPFHVAGEWGVFEDIYCPKEETFTFLENILTEVIDLFPGTYIHIGGDEAPKDRWQESAFCQQLIKEQGLKDEHQLQSYFIRRIETFLNGKGRKLIGWDEILDGGLSPNATVMSWRGEEGGIAAAQQGHDAIMTPGAYCYFNHYQAEPETEPLAFGNYLTLKKVYSYEPVPEELDSAEAIHILGAQGNVWTEYLANPENVEYMVLPRMAALAEVDWSQPTDKNWESFYQRILVHFKVYEALGYHYSKGSYKVNMITTSDSAGVWNIELQSEIPNAQIYYTTTGDDPDVFSTKYVSPFSVNTSSTIKAAIIENGTMKSVSKQIISKHKAFGAKLTLKTSPDSRYAGGDASKLVDGLVGGNGFSDGHWIGFNGNDLELEMELLHPDTIRSVSMRFYQDQPSWIFLPQEWSVTLYDMGKPYDVKGSFDFSVDSVDSRVAIQEVKIVLAPELRSKLGIKVTGLKKNPAWHPGAGENAWFFVDEIEVN